jgi:hypothetical protein
MGRWTKCQRPQKKMIISTELFEQSERRLGIEDKAENLTSIGGYGMHSFVFICDFARSDRKGFFQP